MGRRDADRVTGWLVESDEPAVRYRTRTWLMGQPEGHAAVRRDRARIPGGSIVSALLDLPDPAISPYRKWSGLHWRLVSLADFALPTDAADVRSRLDTAIDRELSWIANPRHLDAIPRIDGLYRSDASIEGNAVYAASRFGHAQDERTRRLVDKLLEWQWPDGGWNCDRRSSGYRSSFHESWATAIGLAAYHGATGDAEALAAARRTAELLLEHRLFRSLDGRRQIHPSMAVLHWPAYWHYDVLAGLRVLLAVDPRLLVRPASRGRPRPPRVEGAAGRPVRDHPRLVEGRPARDLADRRHRLGQGQAQRGADPARGRRAQVRGPLGTGRPVIHRRQWRQSPMNHGSAIDGALPGRASWALSALLLVATGVATVTALAIPQLLHGPAVMVGSMRGTALVVLVLAVPIVIVGMASARQGRLLGVVGWIGAVTFITYQGWMFLFALPFNGMFLVYVAMFGFGFWGLVALLVGVRAEAYAASFTAALPARLLAGWMIASCVAFYALWLKNVVPGSFDSEAPAFLAGTGMVTPTNYVLDMALFLPFTIAVAAALWRRTPWGLVVGGAMLLMLVLESVAIAADQWVGAAADPGSPVASAAITPLFLVVAAITAIAFGLWHRGTIRASARPATAGDLTRVTAMAREWSPSPHRTDPAAASRTPTRRSRARTRPAWQA